ncbi:MAG TPA: hypothetical protein VIF62_03705 [Labilithrix sp.]
MMISVSNEGRWRGALTSRPLPEGDVDSLPHDVRELLATVWLERAASERRVGDAFAIVRDALLALDADPALSHLARRAVDDEMRHAELSRVVASRYAGRELAHPPRLELVVPQHEGAGPQLRRVLWIVGHCAMNETFASAFLEATVATATEPLARAAHRELLSDEIDHARIGWALLASLDERTRAAVERWIPTLAVTNLRMWRTTPRTYAEGLRAHGVLPADAVEAALLSALRDVVIPGIASVGMSASTLVSWLEAGAPTP